MNATKITKQDKINSVLENWKSQYFNGIKWYDEKKQAVYHQLLAVFETTPNPTPEVVDSIIGNSSWTHLNCDVCGKPKKTVYYFKPRYYDKYENNGLDICKKCLGKRKSK